MVRLVRVLAAAAVLALAPEAFAQLSRGQGVVLDKAGATAGLHGIDMMGYSPSYHISWRECIDPKGETLYQTSVMDITRGKLRVLDDGRACFAYQDTNFQSQSCYTVKRSGKGFIFEGDFGGVFVTTRVITGVKKCEPDEDLIS